METLSPIPVKEIEAALLASALEGLNGNVRIRLRVFGEVRRLERSETVQRQNEGTKVVNAPDRGRALKVTEALGDIDRRLRMRIGDVVILANYQNGNLISWKVEDEVQP
jgi:mRNA-degrading endonuclease RelE of RelBE toxin-antitoxin system